MPRKKIYLGHSLEQQGASVIFRADSTPTHESHGKIYSHVVGPFRTVRAARFMAKYGSNNPHCRTVDEAEKLAAPKVRVRCDQCEMLSINGIACHERGCPNMGARWDRITETWIKQRKCFDCGFTVDADDPCCSAPCEMEE